MKYFDVVRHYTLLQNWLHVLASVTRKSAVTIYIIVSLILL